MFISIKKWNLCTKENISVDFVPPLIRRGLSEICKLAISSIHQLNMNYNVPLICASRYGSWQQIIKLAERFYKYQECSPAGFSKVPHNIFAAITSIVYKNTLPYTSISAGEKTFEMGLIESLTQQNNEEIIYTYADESVPEVLQNNIDIKPISFSMLISKNSGNYKVIFSNNTDFPTKTVYDFIDFLNRDDESFITSNFTIINNNL